MAGDTPGIMDCGFQALNGRIGGDTRFLWVGMPLWLPPYSRRNVTLGSSRLARRPGIATAASAKNANNSQRGR